MCQFIETIRIEDGQVYNLSYHTARMNRTRAAFGKKRLPLICPALYLLRLCPASGSAGLCTVRKSKKSDMLLIK